MVTTNEWAGDNPFYLVISPLDDMENPRVIDLDTGWITDHADLLRIPALWELVIKDPQQGRTIIAMFVYEGEQPYYVKRHIGVTGGATNEIEAYGIGKKMNDGHVQRSWILPNGTFCSGEDVDTLGVMLVKQIGPR